MTTARCRRTIRSSARPARCATIWSYGHRNPQGLAWDPVSGNLWSSEHGPGGGDEVNVIERGHNYGWGVATKGTQTGITKTSEPGMDEPVVFYTPSIGPTGMAFYTGDRYPALAERESVPECACRAAAHSARDRGKHRRPAGSRVRSARPGSRYRPGTRRVFLHRVAEPDRERHRPEPLGRHGGHVDSTHTGAIDQWRSRPALVEVEGQPA